MTEPAKTADADARTRTIKLTVSYDGTGFHGWQVQPELRTVQGTLEAALSRILRVPTRPVGAGRTDAGVHARGQVASFETDHAIPCDRLRRALAAKLPEDVSVRDVEEAPRGFNARFSAKGKWYQYRILEDPTPCALERRYAHRSRWPLDVARMRAAAQSLVGRHDFRAYARVRDARPTTRTLFSVDVVRDRHVVLIDVRGDGFLHNMVRTLAGTLIDIGRGARSVTSAVEALRARDRAAAGPTAPARGLHLVEVVY